MSWPSTAKWARKKCSRSQIRPRTPEIRPGPLKLAPEIPKFRPETPKSRPEIPQCSVSRPALVLRAERYGLSLCTSKRRRGRSSRGCESGFSRGAEAASRAQAKRHTRRVTHEGSCSTDEEPRVQVGEIEGVEGQGDAQAYCYHLRVLELLCALLLGRNDESLRLILAKSEDLGLGFEQLLSLIRLPDLPHSLCSRLKVEGERLWVQGLRVQGSGLRAQGSGFR
eukprot:1158570-Rhodomonas_salina.1